LAFQLVGMMNSLLAFDIDMLGMLLSLTLCLDLWHQLFRRFSLFDSMTPLVVVMVWSLLLSLGLALLAIHLE
jgi:hypothetical protein